MPANHRAGPVFYLWRSKILANERRRYICNVFSHWLRPCSVIDRKHITVMSKWARWHLNSPAARLFTQTFIQVQIKGNIKAPRHWPLWGEFTGEFPAQRASNAENVSIWWCHHEALDRQLLFFHEWMFQQFQYIIIKQWYKGLDSMVPRSKHSVTIKSIPYCICPGSLLCQSINRCSNDCIVNNNKLNIAYLLINITAFLNAKFIKARWHIYFSKLGHLWFR